MVEVVLDNDETPDQVARESLRDRLRRDGPWTPANAAVLAAGVATAMSEPSVSSRGWTSLRAEDVLIDSVNRVTFAPAEPPAEIESAGPEAIDPIEIEKQLALAGLVVEMLTGSADDPINATAAQARLEAASFASFPHRLISTVLNGMPGGSGEPNQTVGDYARSLDGVVEVRAQDLIAGAWEAIGRGDEPMALLLVDLVVRYRPGHQELIILLARLQPTAHSGLKAVLSQPHPEVALGAPASMAQFTAAAASAPVFASTPSLSPSKSPLILVLGLGSLMGIGGLVVILLLVQTFS